jgi:HNH endonuclease
MTYCNHGHPKTPENTYKNGQCRPCSIRRAAQYMKDHPEKSRGWSASWKAAHPIQRTAQKHRYRATAQETGCWDYGQWIALKSEHGNACVCCRRPESQLKSLGLKLVPDHVRPLARGGTNFIENLQPLCHGKGGCNNHKLAKWTDYRPGFPIYFV